MNHEPTPPKETEDVKNYLSSYNALQRKIDMFEERLAFLEYTIGSPSSPNLSGMPSGSRNTTSKQERDVIKKLELEEKIRDLYAAESSLREEIEELLEHLENPFEQVAIQMRYIDGAKWRDVSVVLFGNEPDYDDYEERYLKRTFKYHGSALQRLAKFYQKVEVK